MEDEDSEEKIDRLNEEANIKYKEALREIIASNLHTKFCRFDHAEQCFWHYERKEGCEDWSGRTHREWLEKAEAIVGIVRVLRRSSDSDEDFADTLALDLVLSWPEL